MTGTNDRLSTSNAIELIINCNLVVDATDNYEARYIINDACVMLKKPFVTASAMGVEGQLTVIKPYVTACYRCLYPEASITESCRSCADAGVMGPVPGLIGCLEAIEAMKVVMCMEQSIIPQTELSRNKANMQMIPLTGKQILYDASSGEFLNLVLPQRDEECRVCGLNPTITSLDDTLNFLMNSRQSIDSIRSQRNGTDLPFEHISMKLYSVSVHRKSCHLVVDVRSNVQFAMLTLPGLLPLQISTLKDLSSIDLGSAKGFLVNLPLSILVGDLLQEKHGESLSSINLLDSFVRTITNKGGSKVEIYVTCRRGIDSRVATSLLTKHYSHQSNSIEVEVFNLDGGLVAWKNEVDPAFPMY